MNPLSLHLFQGTVVVAAIMALSACSPESRDLRGRRDLQEVKVNPKQEPIPKPDPLGPPDKKPDTSTPETPWILQDGGQRAYEFNPKIDILFVIDNSDSMRDHQENLSRNIDQFVRGLHRNPLIDYHMGVISAWDDSERAVRAARFKSGELRPVRNRNGQEGRRRFLTRAEADQAFLSPTLKIGVQSFDQGGPEKEQFFAPLSASLKLAGRGAPNEGFFREDAQLVVVIVTDADEASPDIVTTPNKLSTEQIRDELVQFKGGEADRVTVYGVLARKGDPDRAKDWGLRIHPKYHPECFEADGRRPRNPPCSPFGPEILDDFIKLANSSRHSPSQVESKFILKLNQADYGRDLAKIGGDIAQRALEKNIRLDHAPLLRNGELLMSVWYGTAAELAQVPRGSAQKIPADATNGWTYDSTLNIVRIRGDIRYRFRPNGRFGVYMAVPAGASVAAPAPAAP